MLTTKKKLHLSITGPLWGNPPWLMDSLHRWPLQWRHNGHNSVSNHQPDDCLLNRLFRRRSKKTSKLCVTGLCVGNSPGTGEFPAQKASNAENFSSWWHHNASNGKAFPYHDIIMITGIIPDLSNADLLDKSVGLLTWSASICNSLVGIALPRALSPDGTRVVGHYG